MNNSKVPVTVTNSSFQKLMRTKASKTVFFFFLGGGGGGWGTVIYKLYRFVPLWHGFQRGSVTDF